MEWTSENLLITDATIEDVAELQEIYEQSSYLGEWDGHPEREEDFIRTCLSEGQLPPSGKKKNYKLKVIRLKETGEAIGYLDLYQGYPSEIDLWLPTMIISQAHQGEGYGRETINLLTFKADEMGFKTIQLIVALKNWPAIRFWSNNGFDNIMNISGDKVYGQSSFANMHLAKEL